MSLQLINQYYNRREKVEQYGGSKKETAIRNEFYNLVNHYCEKKNLILVAELDIRLKNGKTITPDGIVKNALRLDFGYWESKANVDLEYEIEEKIRKGYPLTNTIFEDSKQIILYQDGNRRRVAKMREPIELDNILNEFISFEPQQVTEFNKAVEFFKQDIPQIVKVLRKMIDEQEANSAGTFLANRRSFLALCQESINPNITIQDVNEMLIQHILTEEIFLAIFSDAQFLRENNIARELYKMEETFFTGKTKYDTLQSIKHYYDAIKAAASPIADHHEKQTFLKIIYENFYKAYNPKGADRLGIVYTPSQIIKFMIEGTDYLLEKHFGKTLASKNVEILDPATGTGTYITDLIEYLPKQSLQHKFLHELHANEIAILPYYIANLNIEYTYRQRMGDYQPFSNICFVDTLDNTDSLQNRRDKAKQIGLSFNFSPENAERIKRQNAKKISVIIGNPPYNAKQENYNYQNANKAYTEIDKRIKETYVKEGTAQNQIVLYDMYVRFFRWAMDRLQENGIIAFITNRSFIDSRTFDGFRNTIKKEFVDCYILDTNSDVRANPKISGTGHNVFGIQTGVAIMFLVKGKINENEKCKINYAYLEDSMPRTEKLEWIRNNPLKNIEFENIIPDAKNNWINQTDNDFDELLPLIDKEVKAGKDKEGKAFFQKFTSGVESGRDEWLFDFSDKSLKNKVDYFIEKYNESVDKKVKNETIKWNRDLNNLFERKKKVSFDDGNIIKTHFRPFTNLFHFADTSINYILSDLHFEIVGKKHDNFNRTIAFTGTSSNQPFQVLAVKNLSERHFVEKSQCVPLFRFDKKTGERFENITKWGLEQFKNKYLQLSDNKQLTPHANFKYYQRSNFSLRLRSITQPRLPQKIRAESKKRFSKNTFL